MPSEEDLERTSEFWGSDSATWRTEQWVHSLQHPKVQERLNNLATGKPLKNRYANFVERFFTNPSGTILELNRGITLGCGYGEFERGLSRSKLLRVHEAVDISQESIAQAKRLAQQAGLAHIQYRVADLNTINFPVSSYRFAFGISAIHHVTDLRHLFQQVAAALKPGGYFLLDEYVGPSKFQWTEDQLSRRQRAARGLAGRVQAVRYRQRHKRCESGVPPWPKWTPTDPSEAVCSADIPKLLPDYFDVLEINGYGGSLLHLLLEGHRRKVRGRQSSFSLTCLQSFFDLEDRLIASSVARERDFANIIARKKADAEQPLSGEDGHLTSVSQ